MPAAPEWLFPNSAIVSHFLGAVYKLQFPMKLDDDSLIPVIIIFGDKNIFSLLKDNYKDWYLISVQW